MRELDEYREKLLRRLGEAVMEFCSACLAAAEPFAPIDGGWNVHQIAVHTRDTDRLVYGVRARRTLSEQDPRFENFNGDAYMTTHYDPGEPLADVLEGLAASIQSLVKLLREMPQESWSRTSSHETQGAGITLESWVERGLKHMEEHLESVKKAPRAA